jgi:hypothetical protein
MAGAMAVGATVIGVTFALADGSPQLTYYACVNNSSGTIKIVSAATTCKHNEQKIEWNQAGPAGEPGESGGNGVSEAYVARTGVMPFQTIGASSSLVVAELRGLPAGSYLVTAQETTRLPGSSYGGDVTCTLTPGGAHAIEGVGFIGVGQFSSQSANLVVTDGVTVAEGGVIKYACNGPASLSSDNAVITATRVDTLSDLTAAAPAGPGSLTANVSAALPSKPGTCSLSVDGAGLTPGWGISYTVNGGGPIRFDEVDSLGNYVGPTTVAMDGTVTATTAILYPSTGSWEIGVVVTGADGAQVAVTTYASAACDGVQI